MVRVRQPRQHHRDAAGVEDPGHAGGHRDHGNRKWCRKWCQVYFVDDARGNLTSDGTRSYGYDYDNRLVTVSGGVGLNYDPAGRLHEVSAGGAATRFLYDGDDVIAEYNAAGVLLRRYVHGPGSDEPLVWYEGSGTSDRRYLLSDER